ncbi:class I adenylate-forming enzyme family protein [Arthrobacter sp. A5]|uniref:class I adenylate-forming enzyme family protein n=1 Tax=Arthrobacter sp. A5 TaxID=576926 RepID=UPI003DAA2083
MPFLNQFRRWAREQPDLTAVGVGTERLSYAELAAQAAALVPGTAGTTALCLANSLDLVARFAAAVAGERRCAVLDPRWPETQRSAVHQLMGTAGSTGGNDLADGPGDSGFLIGLTSGTSGTPKGFIRSRRSWQLSFERSTEYFRLTRQDATLAPGPLSASLNLYALSECLYAGAPFFTLPSFNLAGVFQAIREHSITRLVVVPAMLRMIAERANAAGTSASGITCIISAGAKLDAVTVAAARVWAPKAAIYEYFGASELGFVAAVLLPRDEDNENGRDSYSPRGGGRAGDSYSDGGRASYSPRDSYSAGDSYSADDGGLPPTAVGRAFPGVRLSIRDDAGKEQLAGSPGNIYVHSELVSGGYLWGDDGRAFHRDGRWCTVHDQGFLDADGTLHYLGRRSDMMVTSGHNVYPQEVELALQSSPAVATVVVTGVPDGYRGHRIVAAVLGPGGAGADAPADPKTADARTAGALRRAAESALVGYKRPSGYFVLTELPLTAGGKVSRSILAAWIVAGDPRVRRLH